MATVIEKGTKTSYEVKLERYKRRMKIIKISVAVVVVLLAIFFINLYFNQDFNNYKVIHSIERKDSNTVKYIPFGKDLLKYSKDGVSAIDVNGKSIWNGTYEMKDPNAVICEDYVAVADIGGNDIYTVNKKGTTNLLEMTSPITQVEVANQGVVAALLTGKDVSYINLYDSTKPRESPLVELQLHVEKSGYPMDIALSNDGRKLVTSFLNVKNGVVESNLAFYNFGEVGKNEVDNLVGGFVYGQTIVPEIKFIDNNTVCAYGDNKFSIYSMKEKPSLLFEGKFKTEIKSVVSSSSYIGFIVKNYEGADKYRVIVYDLKGHKVFNKAINFEYDQVMISSKEMIFHSDMEVRILNFDGEEKFHYSFDRSINYFYPVNNFNKYILIDNESIKEIKLVEVKK